LKKIKNIYVHTKNLKAVNVGTSSLISQKTSQR